jgi:hypothetical protein
VLTSIASPVRLGLIIDMTLRHDSNGRRRVDVVKEQLISILSKFEDDDQCYLLDHWPITEDRTAAWHVARLTTFQPVPMTCVWESVLDGLSQKVADGEGIKTLLMITDRLQPHTFYLGLRWPEAYGVKVLYLFVGDKPDEIAAKVCEAADVEFRHIKPNEASEQILKFLEGIHERTDKCDRKTCPETDCGREEGTSPNGLPGCRPLCDQPDSSCSS